MDRALPRHLSPDRRPAAASARHRNRWIWDLGLSLVLLAAGLVYTTGIERVVDLGLYDESMYLARGLAAPTEWPLAQNAPLYALWYHVLHWVEPDAVKLYYLNYRVVTCLPPLLLFVALRAYGVEPVGAFLLGLGLLLCRGNLPVWPKVGHAALVLMLAGLAATSRARRFPTRAAGLATTALLAAYLRPEMYLGFLMLTVFVAGLVWRGLRRGGLPGERSGVIGLAALLALAVALALVWGFPLGHGGRSLTAFGQHYAIHWVGWHDDPRDPWTHWQQIVANDFGTLATLTRPAALVAANPAAVIRHVGANLSSLPSTLARLFGSFHPGSRPALVLPILALLVGLMGRRIRHGDGASPPEAVRRDGRAQRRQTVCAGAFLLLPGLVSALWIAPREHYLLASGALALTLLAILLLPAVRSDLRLTVTLLLSILALLLVRPASAGQGSPVQPQRATVRFLRSLETSRPLVILEAEGGFDIYLEGGARRVAEYEKDRPFDAFVAERGINAVVLTPRLMAYPELAQDLEWQALISRPTERGFVAIPVPGVARRWVLIRREVLAHE